MRTFIAFIAILLLISACSTTNSFVSEKAEVKNKALGIAYFNITASKNKKSNDSVCTCIAQAIKTTLIPYLSKAGFKVYHLGEDTVADSLPKASYADVDYVLNGSGIVDRVGSSSFMEQLSLEIRDVRTKETIASASFKGVSTGAAKAANKLGNSLLAKIK